MVKFLIFTILFASLISCATEERLYKKLEREFIHFDTAELQGLINYEKLYVKEGIYETTKSFDIKNVKFWKDSLSYKDCMYIYNDGRILLFTSENPKKEKDLYTKRKSYNAYLIKNGDKIFMKKNQILKMNMGVKISKQEVKIMDDKIYIQVGEGVCFVYKMVE